VEPTGAQVDREHEREDLARARARAQLARRRKRRKRAAFWFSFALLVLVAVGATAVLFGWSPGGGSESDSASPSTTTATTSGLPSLHPPRPYKTTDGVNLRAGPGTTFANMGTIEKGFDVLVVCVAPGETINGPSGATNQWARVDYMGRSGYVTAAYVAIGPEINDPKQINRCP